MQRSPQVEENHIIASSEDDDDGDGDQLQQQFKHLEHDWDSFKQTNARRRLRRCSTDINSVVSLDSMFNTSPRELVSSLQRNKSFSSGEWKVRTNELAVMEILNERRAARESGRFKGRNLSEALDNASTITSTTNAMGIGDSGGCCCCCSCSSSCVLVHKGSEEVQSWCSSSSSDDDDDDDDDDECGGKSYHFYSSSSLSVEEKVENEKEVMVQGKGEEVIGGDDGRKWLRLMGWVAIVLVIFAVCIITYLRSFDGDAEYEDRAALFPT